MEFEWTAEGKLRMRVDEVLHYLWDPIGICDVPEARDEYDSYSGQAFGMLMNGAGAPEISDYLKRTRIERIEVGRGPESMAEDDLAELLVSWKEAILGDSEQVPRETSS